MRTSRPSEPEGASRAVRPPAVAGTFYPRDPRVLRDDVDRLLADARAVDVAPVAVIAPHAGYVYSGPVAAAAWKTIARRRGAIGRVVLIGPAHRVPVRGVATSTAHAFATPIGNVEVDREAVDAVERHGGATRSDLAHAREHCLEVHLPLLLRAIGDVPIVPLVAGDAEPEAVAALLDSLVALPDTLVVVSSDLSHYLDYETARRRDADTTAAIEALDAASVDDDDACGAVAVRGLLAWARQRGLHATTLDVRSSGDTARPRSAK